MTNVDIVQVNKRKKVGYIFRLIVCALSPMRFLDAFRLWAFYIVNCCYGRAVASIGRKTKISPTAMIRNARNVSIGERSYVNHNCILNGGKKIAKLQIGNNVMLGPNVCVYAYNHRFDDREIPMNEQGYTESNVTIEDDVWIGANSIILQGVTVGRGSVIGAGTVVTKDVPAFAIVAGGTAQKIRDR